MRYTAKTGWTGGNSRTLYAVTDKRTGRMRVLPGRQMQGVGPEVSIAVATRSQAENDWQNPLHSGWKVRNPRAEKLEQALARRHRVALRKVRERRAAGERVGWGVLEVDPKHHQLWLASTRARDVSERRRYAAKARNPRRLTDAEKRRRAESAALKKRFSAASFINSDLERMKDDAARGMASTGVFDSRAARPYAPRRNPRKGSRTMAARKQRNRLGHFVKAARRKVRRARDRLGHFIAGGARKKRRRAAPKKTRRARRVRNPRITGGATMSRALVANPRRRRKRRAPKRIANPRRRRARRTPRRRYRRNPGMGGSTMRAAMSSVLPMGLGGIGGALAGFADAKLMSDKPVLSALSKVLFGAGGAVLLRRRPALAYGWAGGVMGSFGYSMGVKAAGGLVAHNATTALKGIADMASDNPEMAALLEGLGDLEPGVGDSDDGTLGDSDYNASLGDDGGVGDLIEG